VQSDGGRGTTLTLRLPRPHHGPGQQPPLRVPEQAEPALRRRVTDGAPA
jgi:hypothetical protein